MYACVVLERIALIIPCTHNPPPQLTPEAIKQQEEDSSLDEFQRVKKRCARQVQEIRKAITDRDELLEKASGSANKTTVEMSARVRTQLRELRANAKKLKVIQIAEETKAAKVENLENKRLNVPGVAAGGAARSNLLANGGRAAYAQVCMSAAIRSLSCRHV